MDGQPPQLGFASLMPQPQPQQGQQPANPLGYQPQPQLPTNTISTQNNIMPPNYYPPQQQQQQQPLPPPPPPQQTGMLLQQQQQQQQQHVKSSLAGAAAAAVLAVPPAIPKLMSSSSSSRSIPKRSTTATTTRRIGSVDDIPLSTRTPDEETVDGRVRNVEAISKIRDAWIFQQVRQRQTEFTQYRSAHCFIGTWNVNAKGKEEPLDEWLCTHQWGRHRGGNSGQPPAAPAPDIVAVGFQEIVDLNAVNVAVDNKTQQRSQFWVERLRVTLAETGVEYTLLQQKSMVGLLICVFVQTVHEPRVRYVVAASVGVGVLGMGGNKGGVSIRLQFYDSTLCFVCSHLAAHRENVTGRNADFANILSKTSFDIGETAIREVIRSGSMPHWTIGSSSVRITDHDIVFWLGDLNYRIDESMATEKVLQLSEAAQLDELRSLDQLNVERAAGRVFEAFEEGPLNFVPTYKYQPGTDVFEQRPDKKLRAPAWCDRILWMAQEDPSHVQQLLYSRSETPNVSDHKPVFSISRMTVKDVMQAKREAIYGELMKLLDRYENQTLPMVGLDRVALDFGEVRYEESITQTIQITNTGSVVAQYRLVPKPDETSVCKPWLSVAPMFGLLVPGEQPSNINLTITINRETAQQLNTGREVLDDVLILRLENGRDYYLTVKANFARSCFGMDVHELVLYSDPIRTIPLDPIERAKKMDASQKTALCVPKELWRIIDAIYEKGLEEPHLFVQPGIPEEQAAIRECLDTGKPFAQFWIHSYADVLVSFLASLSSPIIPLSLFPTVEIDSQNIQMSARRLLEELPPIHYNVFVYVISFFREVLQLRERNLLSAAKIARICSSCMTPPGIGLDESNAAHVKRTGMQLIILHLLETVSI